MGTPVDVEVTLADYRSAIKIKWLPLVGRNQLNRQEYEITQEWYNEGVPLSHILLALNRLIKRVSAQGLTVYSLAVIRADLAAINRERARLNVGSQPFNDRDWRVKWDKGLSSLIEDLTDPEFKAMLSELKRDLLSLSHEEVVARYTAIAKEMY